MPCSHCFAARRVYPRWLANLGWRGTRLASSLTLLTAFVLGSAPWAAAEQDDLPAAADDAALRAEKIQFFEAHVRPVLVNHCTECHGGELQENGLRLDSRAAIIKGGTRGAALLPGDAEQSLLLHAVRHADEELAMPPEEEPLSEEAQLALARWINDGAHWPEEDTAALASTPMERIDQLREEHWAFRPIGNPTPPAVPRGATDHGDWSRNEIDRFVLARLAEVDFSPSPRADRRTLIRRAYFDLVGLPPAYEQVEAFVADRSPDAYERLIDRLLAMPEYGQRWGRHWLDVARYSDTKGYVRMNDYDPRYPFAWTYRDYVVRAFNEDIPYDEFLLQQLAADRLELSEDEQWKLAGLGFMNVGRRFFNHSHRILPERIDLVSRGLLGMTMMCAQCHDHKYDPLSVQDYYALYGVLDSSREPGVAEMPLLDSPADEGDPRFQEYAKEFSQRLQARDKKLAELRDEINRELRARAADYLGQVVRGDLRRGEALAGKKNNAATATTRGPLRQQPGDELGGVSRWRQLMEARAKRYGKDASADPIFGLWRQLSELPEETFAAAAPAIVNEAAGANRLVQAELTKASPQSMVDVARAIGRVIEEVHGRWVTLQEVDPGDAGFEDAASEEIRRLLTATDSPLTVTDDRQARRLYTRADFTEYHKTNEALEETVRRYIDVAPPRAMTMFDDEHPQDAAVHLRGDHQRPGEIVPRRFLEVLETTVGSGSPAGGSGRLEMARAIVHPNNPLTARVMVNRIWGWHFGRGLVATPSDFGTRGSPPSHPQLLDYLSRRFIDEGWSMKKLHRLIMTSATYQQAADDREACREVDPLNIHLWRMNRRRLEFEPMRDAMLAVSDELDTQVGGLPFQDINLGRRSVYYYINRRRMNETLPTFDVAAPDASLARRDQTTVPQQALYLMNSGFTSRRARKLIERLDKIDNGDAKADLSGRIEQLYRWVYGRLPEPDELTIGRAFVSGVAGVRSEPEPLAARQQCWQYGYGHFDLKTKRVMSFHRLPHFNGERWQEGPDSAETTSETAYFTSDSARAGRDEQHAAILRFTPSTGAGLYLFKGQIKPDTNTRIGDGFDIYVLTGQGGLQKQFAVDGNKTFELRAEEIQLAKGDHIDMVVHCRSSNRFDDFKIAPVVWHIERTESGGLRGLTNWQGVDDFERAVPHWVTPLNIWEQYAQALLISNEFMFVD